MKKILLLIISIFLTTPIYAASVFQGEVSEEGYVNSSRIIDKDTGEGIGGAKISIPKSKYTTETNSEGFFELKFWKHFPVVFIKEIINLII